MRELRGSTPAAVEFFGRVVWIVFLFQLTSFFYLLAGFILFIVLPLYSSARCWVKRIFIFAYKGFEERIIG